MKFLVMATVALAATTWACGSDSTADDDDDGGRVATIAALTGDATAGKAVWDSNCASCHGADAKSGSAGKNVAGEASGEKNDAIEKVLTGDGSMPSFSSLSDQEIADVVAYAASLN